MTWLRYRDANCNWHNDPSGGSGTKEDANQCYLNMTVTRLIEIK